MKRKRTILVSLIGLLLVAACNKNDNLVVDPDNPLLGTWVRPQYEGNTVIYSRASNLQDDGYGLVFHANGKLIMRANAGWCGTPPISYANYEGKWNLQGDVLQQTVSYQWIEGDTQTSFKLVEVSRGKLVLQYQ